MNKILIIKNPKLLIFLMKEKKSNKLLLAKFKIKKNKKKFFLDLINLLKKL